MGVPMGDPQHPMGAPNPISPLGSLRKWGPYGGSLRESLMGAPDPISLLGSLRGGGSPTPSSLWGSLRGLPTPFP